jgi:hypothetical protein
MGSKNVENVTCEYVFWEFESRISVNICITYRHTLKFQVFSITCLLLSVYNFSLSCIPFVFVFCFNTVSPSSVFFSLLYDVLIETDYVVSVFRSINA